MYLQTLQLTNFKNYESLNLELSPGLNGFVGNNGCGKTNILDAIYYLSMCKSYLNSNDRQNIRFDQSFFFYFWKLEYFSKIDKCALCI